MNQDNNNPYLFREVPGTWDISFKKWIVGLIIAIVLMVVGIEDIWESSTRVPVYKGKLSGYAWMQIDGAGARWFGLFQVGFAVFLNGRYFWRFLPRRWERYEPIQNGGIALAAISLTVTYAYLWKAHF